MSRRVNYETAVQIREKKREGTPNYKIGCEFGYAPSTIGRVVRKTEGEMRALKSTEDLIERRMRRLRETGTTRRKFQTKLAEDKKPSAKAKAGRAKISAEPSIRRVSQADDLPMFSVEPKVKSTKKQPTNIDRGIQTILKGIPERHKSNVNVVATAKSILKLIVCIKKMDPNECSAVVAEARMNLDKVNDQQSYDILLRKLRGVEAKYNVAIRAANLRNAPDDFDDFFDE